MRIETLVAAMHKTDTSFLEPMNPCTDVVVINQTDNEDKIITKSPNGKRVLFISNKERGLSRSRNAAIDNATADVCIIDDDGFIHMDGIDKIIEEAYETYPDADIITFQMTSSKDRAKSYIPQPFKHNRLTIMKVSSVEITFKLEAVNKVCVKFDEDFGTGSTFPTARKISFFPSALNADLPFDMYLFPLVFRQTNRAPGLRAMTKST